MLDRDDLIYETARDWLTRHAALHLDDIQTVAQCATHLVATFDLHPQKARTVAIRALCDHAAGKGDLSIDVDHTTSHMLVLRDHTTGKFWAVTAGSLSLLVKAASPQPANLRPA